MNGIDAIYFTGSTGSGCAVFVAQDGVATGADPTGGTLDGSYTPSGNDQIDLDVNLRIPTGGMLVTGFANGGPDLTHRITATIPANFGNGEPIAINTPTGPVNVIFRRLREI